MSQGTRGVWALPWSIPGPRASLQERGLTGSLVRRPGCRDNVAPRVEPVVPSVSQALGWQPSETVRFPGSPPRGALNLKLSRVRGLFISAEKVFAI